MINDWNQLDFVLETCPIHGYRITQIPVRTNYDINRNFCFKSEQPLIFPVDRNIIHNLSNETFINPNREAFYHLKTYNNNNLHNVENENNYLSKSYNNYNIKGFNLIMILVIIIVFIYQALLG